MRYRTEIPPEQMAANASNDMLLFTVVLSIFIGIILVWLGHKGRQLWLVFWSVGLLLVDATYLVYDLFIKT